MLKKEVFLLVAFIVLILMGTDLLVAHTIKKTKVVGLVQVRNEAPIIEQCLRALAKYTDSIVVLDDASDDDTLDRVEALAKQLSIEMIIKNKKSAWQVDFEYNNRQKLLDAGRSIGGTHFIIIDADELLSANCMHNNWLKKHINALTPGMVFCMPCVNVWDGITHYRDDAWCNPEQTRWVKRIIFCDDGVCSYTQNTTYGGPARIIHVDRIPLNLCDASGKKIKSLRSKDRDYVLIHFKYVNRVITEVKKNWYMCLEFIRAQQQKDNFLLNAHYINAVYNKKEFECLLPAKEMMQLKPVMPVWLSYSFFDKSVFLTPSNEQQEEIARWFAHYGTDYFRYLKLNRSVLSSACQ